MKTEIPANDARLRELIVSLCIEPYAMTPWARSSSKAFAEPLLKYTTPQAIKDSILELGMPLETAGLNKIGENFGGLFWDLVRPPALHNLNTVYLFRAVDGLHEDALCKDRNLAKRAIELVDYYAQQGPLPYTLVFIRSMAKFLLDELPWYGLFTEGAPFEAVSNVVLQKLMGEEAIMSRMKYSKFESASYADCEKKLLAGDTDSLRGSVVGHYLEEQREKQCFAEQVRLDQEQRAYEQQTDGGKK